MKVVQLTYRSSNCYLIPAKDGWLMIDTGWPDTFSQLLQLLYQNNIPVNEVDYLMITHFHPGHAGLTQNLKDLGTRLILHEAQLPYFNRLNSHYKKNPRANFKDITGSNSITVNNSESRTLLEELGIFGEIISTPGHSEDSVTLILDHECAFIGDLPTAFKPDEYNSQIADSWHMIQQRAAKQIYPGHGSPFQIEE